PTGEGSVAPPDPERAAFNQLPAAAPGADRDQLLANRARGIFADRRGNSRRAFAPYRLWNRYRVARELTGTRQGFRAPCPAIRNPSTGGVRFRGRYSYVQSVRPRLRDDNRLRDPTCRAHVARRSEPDPGADRMGLRTGRENQQVPRSRW